jgi:hypothetical protein
MVESLVNLLHDSNTFLLLFGKYISVFPKNGFSLTKIADSSTSPLFLDDLHIF